MNPPPNAIHPVHPAALSADQQGTANRVSSHMAREIPTARTPPIRITLATRYSGLRPSIGSSPHTVVFTHVPKTGGTTLDHIMAAVAAALHKQASRIRSPRRGVLARAERDQRLLNFDPLSDERLVIHDHQSGNLKPLSDDQLETHDYLSGHFPFGIHRRLPRPVVYVTLLRDPFARLLSQVRFGVDHRKWPRDASVDALIEQGRLVDNLQTRQIAGIADRGTPCTAATLATAIENLRSHYAVVGTTERFDETLKALITLLGWPDIAYSNRQVSVSPSDPGLESKVRFAAERYFGLDMELYATAVARPTPWREDIFEGTASGSARQDTVLLTSPLVTYNSRPASLLPAAVFDGQICPIVRQRGGEVVIV
jgi:hypothetical protein